MGKKVTMQNIADMAGVSRATVDKVIHNRSGVSDEVREKIRQIILDTNYQPAQVRKFLREEKTNLHLAAIMPYLQDPFYNDVKRGMDSAVVGYGIDHISIDYYYYSSMDSQNVLAILEHLKETSINGIAIRSPKLRGVIDRIAAFKEQGIPSFTFDEDLPQSERVGFIGEDTYQTGVLAASLVSKSIRPDGQIAILTSSPRVFSCNNRIRGFRSYLSEHAPGIKVIAIEETLSQQVYTYQQTAKLLKEHPNLDAIWNCVCHSEHMAQAVIDAGKQDQIRLFAFQFNSPSYITELVKNGTIDYAIILSPYHIGKMVIQSLYEYLVSGIAPSKESVAVPIYVGCDANIEMLEKQ